VEYVLAHVNTCVSGTAISKQITVLNAMSKAWDEVSETTIKNLFIIVAGPAKTGHVGKNYTLLPNRSFLGTATE